MAADRSRSTLNSLRVPAAIDEECGDIVALLDRLFERMETQSQTIIACYPVDAKAHLLERARQLLLSDLNRAEAIAFEEMRLMKEEVRKLSEVVAGLVHEKLRNRQAWWHAQYLSNPAALVAELMERLRSFAISRDVVAAVEQYESAAAGDPYLRSQRTYKADRALVEEYAPAIVSEWRFIAPEHALAVSLFSEFTPSEGTNLKAEVRDDPVILAAFEQLYLLFERHGFLAERSGTSRGPKIHVRYSEDAVAALRDYEAAVAEAKSALKMIPSLARERKAAHLCQRWDSL